MHVRMPYDHAILAPNLTGLPPLPMAEMLRFCATATWTHTQLDTERMRTLYTERMRTLDFCPQRTFDNAPAFRYLLLKRL